MALREFQLFGALREYGDKDARMRLEVPEGLRVSEIRECVARELAEKHGDLAGALVRDSAMADERRVLSESETIPSEGELCLLPPVCGG